MTTILRKHRTVFNLADVFWWLQLSSSVRNKVQTWAMSTLYWTAYRVDLKTTPAWCEQKWPRTGKSRSHSPTYHTRVVGRRGCGGENTIILHSYSGLFSHFQYGGFQGFFP